MPTEISTVKALLVLPRLRVQNANAISSPMTWGFPSITAFIGLMYALERRLGPSSALQFHAVGVICNGYEAQVTHGGYTRSFHLTRNPIDRDGGSAALVEEGRVHLDITLVLDVELNAKQQGEEQRQKLAEEVGDFVAGMRVAGGSVMPPSPGIFRRLPRPQLRLMSDDPEQCQKEFRRLCRRWLPGFALVSRDDLLQQHLTVLRKEIPTATALDAWLDLSRLNLRAKSIPSAKSLGATANESIEWLADHQSGWIVPIPVGYAALSPLYERGLVANARDSTTPFRFVESVYSIGQWISPHRLRDVNDLLWYNHHDATTGLYRCSNDFQAPSSTTLIAI